MVEPFFPKPLSYAKPKYKNQIKLEPPSYHREMGDSTPLLASLALPAFPAWFLAPLRPLGLQGPAGKTQTSVDHYDIQTQIQISYGRILK